MRSIACQPLPVRAAFSPWSDRLSCYLGGYVTFCPASDFEEFAMIGSFDAFLYFGAHTTIGIISLVGMSAFSAAD